MSTNRSYLVAQFGSLVVGYSGVMWVDEEAHLTNIAVDPTWQQNQIATRMLLQHARMAITKGATDMTLEVRVSNKPAQRLYTKFGFAPAGIRKNYYQQENEDAMIMWANGIATDAYQRRLADIEASVYGNTTIDARISTDIYPYGEHAEA